MENLELVPLSGFGRIKLGMPRKYIHQVMGVPMQSQENIEYYLNASVQIHYSENALVEFIEIASGQRVFWNGLNIFTTPVEDLIPEVAKKTTQLSNEPEPGYSYTFPEYELSFWRPTQPDEETPDEGIYFESVGLGCKGYFSGGI